MTLDEILVALGAFIGADKAKAQEAAKAMRAHADVQIVAQELVTYGVGKGKKELEPEVTRLTAALTEMTAERDEAVQAHADLQAKTPDVAAQVAALTEKHKAKLKEKDDAIAAKDTTLKAALVDVRTEQAVARAIAEHRVDPEYAREVLKPKLARRMKPNDDGKVTILRFGSDDSYDADSDDKAIDALVADAAKAVPATFILTNADRGGGEGGGKNSGSVKKTTKELIEQKRASGEYVRA